jgi:hypothetical protein
MYLRVRCADLMPKWLVKCFVCCVLCMCATEALFRPKGDNNHERAAGVLTSGVSSASDTVSAEKQTTWMEQEGALDKADMSRTGNPCMVSTCFGQGVLLPRPPCWVWGLIPSVTGFFVHEQPVPYNVFLKVKQDIAIFLARAQFPAKIEHALRTNAHLKLHWQKSDDALNVSLDDKLQLENACVCEANRVLADHVLALKENGEQLVHLETAYSNVVSGIQKQVDNFQKQVDNLTTLVSERDTQVSERDTQVSERDTQVSDCEKKVSNLQVENEQLKQKNDLLVKQLERQTSENLQCTKQHVLKNSAFCSLLLFVVIILFVPPHLYESLDGQLEQVPALVKMSKVVKLSTSTLDPFRIAYVVFSRLYSVFSAAAIRYHRRAWCNEFAVALQTLEAAAQLLGENAAKLDNVEAELQAREGVVKYREILALRRQ